MEKYEIRRADRDQTVWGFQIMVISLFFSNEYGSLQNQVMYEGYISFLVHLLVCHKLTIFFTCIIIYSYALKYTASIHSRFSSISSIVILSSSLFSVFQKLFVEISFTDAIILVNLFLFISLLPC